MKVLSMLLVLLLLSIPSASLVLKGKSHRKFLKKFFPATTNSVLLENEVADGLHCSRIADEQQLLVLVQQQVLVPIRGVDVSNKLPVNRRYALPATVSFMEELNVSFYSVFKHSLVVDSAVRPATVQKRLRLWNRNAAPATGERASSHERGTTVDISRRLSRTDYQWLVTRLLYYRALHRILVIEERACFHIFVGGSYEEESHEEKNRQVETVVDGQLY